MILRTTIGAFLANRETIEAVEAIKEDRIFLRSSFAVHDGGIAAATTYLGSNPTPAIVLVESMAQGDALYDELNKLADVCAPNTFVILIGVQNDIMLYRELIREGIADYLTSPITGEQLIKSIEDVFKGDDKNISSRAIAFTGVSGGAGSSVLAHNVAYELVQAYDMEVIVIDLDIAYGTAALNYNFQPRQTIVDVMTQAAQMDESFLEQFLMEYIKKLTVLSSPASMTSGVKISFDAIANLIKYAKRMADVVVLDVPHAWEPWVRDLLTEADDVVLIAKPDLTNLRNAKNIVEFLTSKRKEDVPMRVILNQVGAAKKTDLSHKDFKDALAIEPALSIPYDPEAFGKAINNGEMMSKASAKSKATEMIIQLAKLVSGREAKEDGENKKGGFSLFKKEKKEKKETKEKKEKK